MALLSLIPIYGSDPPPSYCATSPVEYASPPGGPMGARGPTRAEFLRASVGGILRSTGAACPMYNRHYGCAKTGGSYRNMAPLTGPAAGRRILQYGAATSRYVYAPEAEESVFWKAYWYRRQVCSTPNHRRLAIPSRQFRGYLRSF